MDSVYRPPQTGLTDTFGWRRATEICFGSRELRVTWGTEGRDEATEFAGNCEIRGSGMEPKDLGPPQLDSVRPVPIGTRTEGSGNRVSVKR